jgi:hypothetical protein
MNTSSCSKRASEIRATFAKNHDARLNKFNELHQQHVEAIRKQQQILAHELNNKIQTLLTEGSTEQNGRGEPGHVEDRRDVPQYAPYEPRRDDPPHTPTGEPTNRPKN